MDSKGWPGSSPGPARATRRRRSGRAAARSARRSRGRSAARPERRRRVVDEARRREREGRDERVARAQIGVALRCRACREAGRDGRAHVDLAAAAARTLHVAAVGRRGGFATARTRRHRSAAGEDVAHAAREQQRDPDQEQQPSQHGSVHLGRSARIEARAIVSAPSVDRVTRASGGRSRAGRRRRGRGVRGLRADASDRGGAGPTAAGR